MKPVVVLCPKCYEPNMSDAEIYRVRCFKCKEIFINPKCSLKLDEQKA